MRTVQQMVGGIALAIVMSVVSSVPAQGQSGMNIALLDLGYVFKNHPGFAKKMEAMKAEVAQYEQTVKGKQQELEAAGRQIGTFKPGTPEYKKLEESTTQDLAQLKVDMQLKRKEIMEREAQIYMETYQEVARAVASFANAKNIDLVLRYDRDSDESAGVNDPRETLKVINRPVIFEKQLDISDLILKSFAGGPAAGSQPPVARRPASVPK